MIYGKHKLVWQGEPETGFGPDEIIRERGDSITGAFYESTPQGWIYCYLNDGFDFTGLEAWQVTEVTQAEILEKAQEHDPNAFVNPDGQIQFPLRGIG